MGTQLHIGVRRTFSQPIKVKTHIKTLKLKYVSLAIKIALFFMLAAQGIESNPGPTTGNRRDRDVGTRISSALRREVTNADDYVTCTSTPPLAEPPQISGSTPRGQPSVSTWLSHGNSRMQNDESAVSETDDIDITSILLEIRRDVKSLDKRFDSLEDTVRELKSDNTFRKKKQNAELTSSVAFLSNKVNSIEKDLKAASTKKGTF